MTNPQMGWLDKIVGVSWGGAIAIVMGDVFPSGGGGSAGNMRFTNSNISLGGNDFLAEDGGFPPYKFNLNGDVAFFGEGGDDSVKYGFAAFYLKDYPKGVTLEVTTSLTCPGPGPATSIDLIAFVVSSANLDAITLHESTLGGTLGRWVNVSYRDGKSFDIPFASESFMSFSYPAKQVPVLPYGISIEDQAASDTFVQTVSMTSKDVSISIPAGGGIVGTVETRARRS